MRRYALMKQESPDVWQIIETWDGTASLAYIAGQCLLRNDPPGRYEVVEQSTDEDGKWGEDSVFGAPIRLDVCDTACRLLIDWNKA